jgi:cytochrome c oxidase assembly protein subunit 15
METAAAAPLAMSPGVALFGGLTVVVGVLGVVAVLAGRVRPMTLALGFAGVAVQWALAYVAMTGVGQWVGEALFGLTVLVPAAVGWASARWAADRSGPVAAGLVGGFVNLLVVGSVIQGKDAEAALSEAGLWSAGLLAGSAVLAAAGGAVGRRKSEVGVLPEPVCLFAIVTAATIFLLLITGGLVTGLEAGLAVPDWPNSFGHNMLLYPVSEMKEGRYYEHAHRLFGMLVGLSSFTLAALCWRHERRASIRWAASVLLLMVCVQGLMGGLRVTGMFTLSQDPSMLAPSTLLAIAHGIFGQVVFATAAWIAAATSGAWRSPATSPAGLDSSAIRLWSTMAPVVLLLQLFLGAAYRHLQVSPTASDEAIRHPTWAMHGHIGFSVVALIVVLIAASRMSAAGRVGLRPLGRSGAAMAVIVAVQVGLGLVALGAVLMRRGPAIPAWELLSTSAHQATGALLLMAAVQGAAWSRRLLPATGEEPRVTPTFAKA